MNKHITNFFVFISLFKIFGWRERRVHIQDWTKDLVQTCIEEDQELVRKTAARIPVDMVKKMAALSRLMCVCSVEANENQKAKNLSKDASLDFSRDQKKRDESYDCLYSKFRVTKKLIQRTAREILAYNNHLDCIDLLKYRSGDFLKNFGVTKKNKEEFIYTLCSCNNPFRYFITNEDRIPNSHIVLSGLFGEILLEMYNSENSFPIPKLFSLSCIEFIKTNEG